MKTQSLIQLSGARKGFSGKDVLKKVDFELTAGELVAIVGVNGAGKTTLLRLCAGLLGLDAGELLIKGEPLDRFSEAQREHLFFLPDFPVFFEDCSVLENIGLWINLYGKANTNREAEALALLEEFSLMEKVKKSPGELSRGQRYKLALTCYDAVEAPIALFDEPFASGMDAKGITTMRRIIRKAVESGRGAVYTTQLVELALDFADRIVVIEDNGIYFNDHPEAFRKQLLEGDEILEQYVS